MEKNKKLAFYLVPEIGWKSCWPIKTTVCDWRVECCKGKATLGSRVWVLTSKWGHFQGPWPTCRRTFSPVWHTELGDWKRCVNCTEALWQPTFSTLMVEKDVQDTFTEKGKWQGQYVQYHHTSVNISKICMLICALFVNKCTSKFIFKNLWLTYRHCSGEEMFNFMTLFSLKTMCSSKHSRNRPFWKYECLLRAKRAKWRSLAGRMCQWPVPLCPLQ